MSIKVFRAAVTAGYSTLRDQMRIDNGATQYERSMLTCMYACSTAMSQGVLNRVNSAETASLALERAASV